MSTVAVLLPLAGRAIIDINKLKRLRASLIVRKTLINS